MRHASKRLAEQILTEGGLVRTLKVGCPGDTMHLWCQAAERSTADGDPARPSEEFLIEIELLGIRGDNAIVRLWAPQRVHIVSAKKDPRCQCNPSKPEA